MPPQPPDVRYPADESVPRDNSDTKNTLFTSGGVSHQDFHKEPNAIETPSAPIESKTLGGDIFPESIDMTSNDGASPAQELRASNPPVEPSERLNAAFVGISPPGLSKSVESLGSESGAGNGLAGENNNYGGNPDSLSNAPALRDNVTESSASSEAKDTNQHESPVSKLHVAAGAAGIIGTAASLSTYF